MALEAVDVGVDEAGGDKGPLNVIDLDGGGEFLLFEKVEGSYTKAKLPFNEEQETGVYTLLCDGKRNGELAHFMIPSLDFGKSVRITDEEIWDEWYGRMIERASEYADIVWYAEPCNLSEGVGLKCYIHLFDKWSIYGYIITVRYVDGAYEISDVQCIIYSFHLGEHIAF